MGFSRLQLGNVINVKKKLCKQEVGIKIIDQILYQRHRRNVRCHQNKRKA